MQTTDLALDSLGRVHELIPAVIDGLCPADLTWRPDPHANPIGWLLWHLLRVEDDHLAHLGGIPQVWLTEGWCERFALPYPGTAHGFGMSWDEVSLFTVTDTTLLTGYAEAVSAQSSKILAALTEADFDRVVDTRFDPPVTLGVRLVSVIVETAQHIGQASYVRGLLERSQSRASRWSGIV
ncbi:MAG: DinB family protein [Propionicimonas sp.]